MITERKNETKMVSESNTKLHAAKVGDRVECLGHMGTVKYIGPVESHSATWLGIDWDNPDRGKHNGTVKGVNYFEARFPKSGSFVRPEKVEFGQSVVTSIVDHYGHTEDEYTAQINQQKLMKFQQSINAPFLEMVGFEKVSNKLSDFDSLRIVNLRLLNISSAGEQMELKNLCPQLEELDLSKNLISSWTVVFDICVQLERLSWLNLSENLLSIPEDTSNYHFPSLETLICTSMNMTWEQVLQIGKVFPNLKELRAPFNSITELNTPNDVFQHLRILDIEDNEIGKWSEVCKLSVLSNLEELFVGNIGLRSIEFEGMEPKVDIFKNLKKLSISNNLIDNWESFNELNRMKYLEDLRCVKNPILETQNEATRFQIIVAKIANLKIFNGTEIKADNRRGAEYDYIKLYGLEWLKLKTEEEKYDFSRKHNRYLELIEKHGVLEESELLIPVKSIKSTLVTLNLVHEQRTVSKKLPRTIIVQKLIMLVQKLFNLSERPNLLYVCTKESNIKINLDDAQKEIGFYSIEDGDQIIASL